MPPEPDNATEPTAPSGTETEGRLTLAALVCDGVANFGARARKDGTRAAALLSRDRELAAPCVARHGGVLLKTTEDMAFLYFDSAAHAVAAALEIRQALAEAAPTLPRDEILGHRFGIHLGDVMVTDANVTGPSLDIAAHLQSQAAAGEICLSRTVMEVAKPYLDLQAVYLGSRQFPNLPDALPVFRLAPEALELAAGSRRRRAVWRIVLIITAALLLLGGAAGALAYFKKNAVKPPPPDAKLVKKTAAPAKPAPPKPPPPPKTVDEARKLFLARQDLAGLQQWLGKNGDGSSPAAQNAKILGELQVRIKDRLATTSMANPLLLGPPPPAGTARGKTGDPFRAWREADGRITLENPGGRQTLKLQDVPFKNSRLILLALLKELPPDSPEAQKLHRALPVAEEEYGKASLFTPVPTARTGTGQTAATPPAPSQTAP